MANISSGATAPTLTTSTPAVITVAAPDLPATPAGTADYISQGIIATDAAIEVMKSSPYMEPELYNYLLDLAQDIAGKVLDEGLRIADKVRALGPTKGSGAAVAANRAAKEKLRVAHGFKKDKRWRNICELDADCVEKAKAEAKANGDVPTINSALTIKRGCKKKNPPLGVYPCHGIFSDVDLPKNIKFDKKWRATSLFANIGLGTYMLKKLNIEVSVANELWYIRAQIHQALYSSHCQVISGSITDKNIYEQIVQAHKERNCRIVLMSPPCQSYSKAGTQNVNRVDASLVMTGMQFLEDVDGYNDVFMCENVVEFLGACPDIIKDEGYDTIYDYIKDRAEQLGYITNIDYLNADCYGTGENRNRAIILGIKEELVQYILGTTETTKNNVWKFPKPDEFKMSEEVCLWGMPSIEAGEHRTGFNRLHYALDLEPEIVEALKNIMAGKNTLALVPNSAGGIDKVKVKRAHGDRPAPTITGESSHSGAPAHYFPAGRCRTDGTQSDARYRTLYEILVLMGMPKDFELPENIKIKDDKGNIWCKSGPVPESDPTAIQPDDIVVSDEAFRTMLGEHYCPTVVNRCFAQLIYQIQNKDF